MTSAKVLDSSDSHTFIGIAGSFYSDLFRAVEVLPKHQHSSTESNGKQLMMYIQRKILRQN